MKKLLLILSATAALAASAVEVKVDPAKAIGPVKPVNGVGQPPLLGGRTHRLFKYLEDAHVPFSRLHDMGGMFGKGVFVDIPNIFRDFDADENDPANYDFAFTDNLLAGMAQYHIVPFYRLGVTIENYPDIKAYRIFPPKDYAKWARICEHVMAHYVEGWANGFRYKVSHWEIWNEADFHPDTKKSMMWQAPFEEYIRLYLVASKHLKARFPNEKIGGFASCGFYAAVDSKTEQQVFHLKCIHEFLAAVQREKAPLDFFSYHTYSGVEGALAQVAAAQKILEQYGFGDVETCLNEWLPRPHHDRLGTAEQASEIAAQLIGFQNSSLKSAAIYDARCGVGNYSPLFNPLTYKPHKAYYAFTAFDALRQLGTAVAATSDAKHVYAAAAAKDGQVAVMLANFSKTAEPMKLDLGGAKPVSCRLTDDARTDVTVSLPAELPPFSFLVVQAVRPQSP